MEFPGGSAYALAKALGFPGIYEVICGDRAITADTAVRLGSIRPAPAQFRRTTTISDLQRQRNRQQDQTSEGGFIAAKLTGTR